MNYDQEKHVDDLVDLGVATEEVRGAQVGTLDLTGGLKIQTGLSED